MKGETERSRASRLTRKVRWFFILLFRPFYDFYYNYGLSKASVLAYVLCANLILFVYLVLGFVSFINPFQTDTSSQRFLEVHFLWPMEDQIMVTQAPRGFRIGEGAVVSKQEYQEALDNYKEKYKKNAKMEVQTFSVTRSLGERAHKSLSAFYEKDGSSSSYGVGIFLLFALAYLALLLATTSALAEVDTPIIRGNVPLKLRESTLTRMKWYIPTWSTIQTHIMLFGLLPTGSAAIIGLLSMAQIQIDRFIDPYSNANMVIILSLSFIIVTVLFFLFYWYSLTEISISNLFIGALVASSLWLLGRWFFTTYTAVSFERSLHNFAFVPMIMTWLYYFCAVFIVGAHVAHTIQYSYLSSVARAWIRKEVDSHSQFTRMANWIKVDFLLRLAHGYYNKKEKEILIREGKKRGPRSTDVADQIALYSQMHPSFVREILLDMIVKDMNLETGSEKDIKIKNSGLGLFKIKTELRKQKCFLNKKPWEVDVSFLLHNIQEENYLQEDLEDYEIPDYYKRYFSLNSMTLDQLYKDLLEEGLYFVNELDKARENFKKVDDKWRKKEAAQKKKEEPLGIVEVLAPVADASVVLLTEKAPEVLVPVEKISVSASLPIAPSEPSETPEISRASEEDTLSEDPRQGLLFSSPDQSPGQEGSLVEMGRPLENSADGVEIPPLEKGEATPEEEEKSLAETLSGEETREKDREEDEVSGAEIDGNAKREEITALDDLRDPREVSPLSFPFPATLPTKDKVLPVLYKKPEIQSSQPEAPEVSKEEKEKEEPSSEEGKGCSNIPEEERGEEPSENLISLPEKGDLEFPFPVKELEKKTPFPSGNGSNKSLEPGQKAETNRSEKGTEERG